MATEHQAKTSDAFVRELVEGMPSAQAKLAALTVLAKWAGQSIYLPMDSKAARRRRAARNMLANGMAPADVAAALRERFGVSARTAQRDVSSSRQMSAESGADREFNVGAMPASGGANPTS